MKDVDAREYQWWQVYYKMYPFGEYRSDIRNGLSCSLFANANRDIIKDPQPFSISDFIYPFDRISSLPTKDELAIKVRRLLSMGKRKK